MIFRQVFRGALCGAVALSAAGCSSIGTVNGVPVARGMAMEDDRPWCRKSEERTMICILVLAAGVGAIAWGISELHEDDRRGAGNGNGEGGGEGGGTPPVATAF
ncbi:hypothetical protein ACQ5SO_20735 [Rhodovulum sp. DZ06]|uniref:hypothetical protein n=1 Tax=Rhodovulum sp. DZ06 TaxID=3425126 RepID=UPI003D34E17E